MRATKPQAETGFHGWQACTACGGTGEAAALVPQLPAQTTVPRGVLRQGDQRRQKAGQRAAQQRDLRAFLAKLTLSWDYALVACRACRGRGGKSW